MKQEEIVSEGEMVKRKWRDGEEVRCDERARPKEYERERDARRVELELRGKRDCAVKESRESCDGEVGGEGEGWWDTAKRTGGKLLRVSACEKTMKVISGKCEGRVEEEVVEVE